MWHTVAMQHTLKAFFWVDNTALSNTSLPYFLVAQCGCTNWRPQRHHHNTTDRKILLLQMRWPGIQYRFWTDGFPTYFRYSRPPIRKLFSLFVPSLQSRRLPYHVVTNSSKTTPVRLLLSPLSSPRSTQRQNFLRMCIVLHVTAARVLLI